MEPIPYEERFWRSSTLAAVKFFAPPVGVQGFICALPTNWTRGENNDSGINLIILAQLLEQSDHWEKGTDLYLLNKSVPFSLADDTKSTSKS